MQTRSNGKSLLPKTCNLCGKTIRYGRGNKRAIAQGLLADANTHDHDAKSQMHYAHVSGKSRSRKQFATLSQAAWDQMGVKNCKGRRTCCYECHEVILHNIVISEEDFDELAKLFSGKDFEERVVLLNRVFSAGLRQVTPEE
jgi:hypothetical protein